jgi:hypothetical protein
MKNNKGTYGREPNLSGSIKFMIIPFVFRKKVCG